MNVKQLNWAMVLLISGFALSGIQANASDEEGFFQQSHLDLTLKNIWMVNTNNAFAEDDIGPQNVWAQALLVDYRSGWFQEWLGLDASWYGVSKLHANRSFAGRDLVRDHHGHAEGFQKLGQLYLRTQWGDKQHFLKMKGGWQQLNKFAVLNVTHSRAAPSSWQGISGEARYQQFYLRGAVVNQFSERDEPEKRHIRTLKSNKRIDYIATGDLTWQPQKGRAVTLVAGESKDYLRREGIETAWTQPLTAELNLLLRGVWYRNSGLSEWEGARGFDHHAEHLYGLAGLQNDRVEGGFGWSKTRAHLSNNLGRFYWHMGKNTRGAFNSKADGPGNDYVNDGEQMFYLYGQYQLSPEWLTGIYGYYGNGMRYQGVSLHEYEFGGFVSWAPESLHGLTLLAALGPSTSWKYTHGKPTLTVDGEGYHHSRSVGSVVSIEYKFGLF
ncbi:OprD family outer membrane porin [Erwinia sp. JUb26]|uniref:OprD family outer membrane porin n=1 Tax=Erwinia sp. JUb26 TaxID=2485126 RepID=UPI000F47A507|nr:OprD family outer membrane porin [Erwinia sp. JUb26]ROR15012.1 outer membrane OprD family porin [Erwinia sp. JUb26]